MAEFRRVAVMGSGSFGTAMGVLLAEKCPHVHLIGRDPEVVASIERERRNVHYLAEVTLPPNVSAGLETNAACASDLVVFAVPTAATRQCANELRQAGIGAKTILLSCAKGLELDTGLRMSEILREVLPDNPVAVLSGPNHAEEIAHKLAACAVIGAEDFELARTLQELFALPWFRPYTSQDVAGIELGGAIKNVYAIAAGVAVGLGLGDNAVAALVTRALAEMTRLGVALGGRMETFAGLSGVGDLIVTCFSEHSRNHRVGRALGEGKSLAEATAELGMVAEGVPNTRSIHQAAKKAGARTPVIDAMHALLYEGKSARAAMNDLLTRDIRNESD